MPFTTDAPWRIGYPYMLLDRAGALQRNLSYYLSEVQPITPQDFKEGVGQGNATIDTAAFNAAIAHATPLVRKAIKIPAGHYKLNSTLTITGNLWDIRGEGMGSSAIEIMADVPHFTIDLPAAAASMFFGNLSDMTLFRSGTVFPNSRGVKVLAGPSVDFGLNYWTFERLRLDNLQRGIEIDDTSKLAYDASRTGKARHFGLAFNDLLAVGNAVENTVRFIGGSGTYHRFTGGFYRGTGAAISIGNGGDDVGVGDILFNGVTIFASAIGIDIIGPSATVPTAINQGVTVTGSEFSFCTTATIRLDRMSNFRIIGNNPPIGSAGVVLVNCAAPYLIEDHSALTMTEPLRLPSYTVATLPAPVLAGQEIYVSDGSSNRHHAMSDGTNWRFADGSIVS